jgi:CRISPR-associated protein Cas5/CasD subtype I-E
MNYLPLHLEAFLQSYGTAASAWAEYRDTALIPTRSMLIGLIACAMGLRETDEGYKDLEKLKFYCKVNNSESMDFLIDFQVVRPYKSKYSNKNGFLNAEGGRKAQFLLEKHYLCDSSFEIYVGNAVDEYLKFVYESIKHPVWAYYLGRACCTPSKPLIEKEFFLINENSLNVKELVLCT